MPIMMIFAVVVIALIVAAGIYAGQLLLSAGTASNVQSQIGMAASNVQSLYGTSPDFSSLTPAVACQGNVYPPAMLPSGGCGGNNLAMTPYGGVDVVSGQSVSSPLGNNSFAVVLGAGGQSSLQLASCIQIVTDVPAWGIYGSPGSWLVQNNQMPTPAAAQSWCANMNGGTIDFVFAKNS
ncbi:MAG: hypothetical protein ACYCSN_20850 [Acidobacteriaceae bacterium]